MPVKIKIYGERNSGTNYLEKLIKLNLKTEVLDFQTNWRTIFLLKLIRYDFIQDFVWNLQLKKTLGWKHGCAPIEEIQEYNTATVIIITITKNPYAFLYSLYKNPYHIKGDKPSNFSKFIQQKWKTRKRDLCKKKYLDSPIELWNIKNKSYVNLKTKSTKNIINITYEQLIKNPEKCIHSIAEKGSIEFLHNREFQNYHKSTKDSEITYNEYKDYYLAEKWGSKFTAEDLIYIKSKIDNGLMSYFNYKEI